MDNSGKIGAFIVAAGSSQRMGGTDKLLALLGGKPLLVRVIDAFQRCDSIGQIILVLSERNLGTVRRLITKQSWQKKTELCLGGERRQDSVLAGLDRLDQCDWVVIHDGARPLVTVDLIDRGLKGATETGAAAAAVPVTDTIKVAGTDRIVRQTPSRGDLWAVQTPQVFRFDIIAEAYRRAKGEVTDDATLVERSGYKVKLYPGSYDNIKLTTPDDLVVAAALLRERGK